MQGISLMISILRSCNYLQWLKLHTIEVIGVTPFNQLGITIQAITQLRTIRCQVILPWVQTYLQSLLFTWQEQMPIRPLTTELWHVGVIITCKIRSMATQQADLEINRILEVKEGKFSIDFLIYNCSNLLKSSSSPTVWTTQEGILMEC